MASKNKHQAVQSKVTFSVAKEAVYPNLKTGNAIRKDRTLGQTDLNSTESIAGIDRTAIKEIEEKLNLTFLSEKDEDSYVCMANSPEVRDVFKDIFDLKDLLNYSYAVLHWPSYLEKYKDATKIELFQVPYPNDPYQFWELVDLGAKLRYLNLLEVRSVENNNIATNEILKKIAAIKIA